MASKLLGKIVEVKWEDAWFSDRSFNFDDIKKEDPFYLTTVGYVIRDDKTGITLSPELSFRSGLYRNCHHVCRAMIRKVRRLK